MKFVKRRFPASFRFFICFIYFFLFSTPLLKGIDAVKTPASGERVAIHVFGIQKYPQIDLFIKHLQSSSKMVKEARLRAAKVGEFIFEGVLKISARDFGAQSKVIQIDEMKLLLTEQEKEKLVYHVQE